MFYLDQNRSEIVLLDENTLKPVWKATDVGRPDGIQVDKEKGVLYWTDMGAERVDQIYPKNDGSVNSMNLDGTNRKMLAGNGSLYTPKQLRLHKQSDMLYWCDREGGRVMRCRTDGSHLETLVQRSADHIYPKDILDRCVGIVLDYESGVLYWTQKGPSKAGKGRIFMCNLEIPEGQSAETRSDVTLLLDNLPEPIDLELDRSKRVLYWTDRGAPPSGNSLNRAHIVGGSLQKHEVLCTGFKEAIGLTFNETFDLIFIADLSGNLYMYDMATGKLKVFYEDADAITGICV